jgi:hypothetical protein
MLIHHAGFPFPTFPIQYPTNVPGLSLPGDYNLRRDFSITRNPAGVWSYGWKSELAGRFQLFRIPRRDLRDLEDRGDYQQFAWCEEVGREPVLSYTPGPCLLPYVKRDPKTGRDRTWHLRPAGVSITVTDGQRYPENSWAGIRFTAPRAGTYEFRVQAHALPQFERFQETTRIELIILKGATSIDTRLFAPDEYASLMHSIAMSPEETVEFLCHTRPRRGAQPCPSVELDVEVYDR